MKRKTSRSYIVGIRASLFLLLRGCGVWEQGIVWMFQALGNSLSSSISPASSWSSWKRAKYVSGFHSANGLCQPVATCRLSPTRKLARFNVAEHRQQSRLRKLIQTNLHRSEASWRIPSSIGFKAGCLLSPFLFLPVLYSVMARVKKSQRGIAWHYLLRHA